MAPNEGNNPVSDHYLNMPYLTGVYLAVNAIQDAYLVVDGPNCVFFRTAQIQGNHDWHSSLVSCTGLHRVADTDCTTERAAAGDQRLLISRLMEVDQIEDCRLILLSAMSPVAVTAPQYDKVIKGLDQPLTRPLVQIRAGSLSGDWLHGFRTSLEDLAGQIELPESGPVGEEEVAIVGYLMDRNEADHTANLAEMKRLIEGMGLTLCSCWLDGGGYRDLQRVARAGTIISFPYARKAAGILAGRTGAKVIDCDLPLGPGATCAWLRRIGEATGRSDEAEALIDREMKVVAPKLEWVLPHAFLNKELVLMGSDPVLLEAVGKASVELGCRVLLKLYFTHPEHLQTAGADSREAGLRLNPGDDEIRKILDSMIREDEVDLVITNSRTLRMLSGVPRKLPFVELGFPSYYTHAFFDNPFLGYRGALRLVERMANAVSHAAALPDRGPGSGQAK